MITNTAAVACTCAGFLAGIGFATAAIIPGIRHRTRQAIRHAWRPPHRH